MDFLRPLPPETFQKRWLPKIVPISQFVIADHTHPQEVMIYRQAVQEAQKDWRNIDTLINILHRGTGLIYPEMTMIARLESALHGDVYLNTLWRCVSDLRDTRKDVSSIEGNYYRSQGSSEQMIIANSEAMSSLYRRTDILLEKLFFGAPKPDAQDNLWKRIVGSSYPIPRETADEVHRDWGRRLISRVEQEKINPSG